ncbi:hypothetical protein QF045_001877 [Pseudomonas sp. W4I3]|nr:hypothetical protein [Pseudomonas sp. W4I3]
MGQSSLQLHPSLATLNSCYAVVAIWAAHQTDDGLAGLNPWPAQNALILRQGLAVKVFAIDSGSVAFIECLSQGMKLETAVEHALRVSSEFELHRCLALLISHDAITHLHLEQKVSP